MTFALNFIALTQSEVDQLQTSTVGWILIAVTWTVIGALWLAASLLSAPSAHGQATKRLRGEMDPS